MFNFKRIRSIPKNLNKEACHTLINGLIMSHLDYCNSILAGIPKKLINKLQHIQNLCAKLILSGGRYDSSTQALKDLHWLPIGSRIDFKILTLIHKCLHGQVLDYLSNLLVLINNQGTLKSGSESKHLLVPRTKRVTFADRSFSVYGPRIWNNLPNYLREIDSFTLFKNKLKTYLFQCVFH